MKRKKKCDVWVQSAASIKLNHFSFWTSIKLMERVLLLSFPSLSATAGWSRRRRRRRRQCNVKCISKSLLFFHHKCLEIETEIKDQCCIVISHGDCFNRNVHNVNLKFKLSCCLQHTITLNALNSQELFHDTKLNSSLYDSRFTSEFV